MEYPPETNAKLVTLSSNYFMFIKRVLPKEKYLTKNYVIYFIFFNHKKFVNCDTIFKQFEINFLNIQNL